MAGSWSPALLYMGLSLCCHVAHAFLPPHAPHTVIESDVAVDREVHVVTSANLPVKLRCKHLQGSRVDDIMWEYKKCGPGLSLTACEDLPKDTPWLVALCRNQTKVCTGATLPIVEPAEADSGLYRCLHKNYMMREFRVNRSIQLQVRDFRTKSIEMLPEVAGLDKQSVLENGTAVMRCRVRSVRFPVIVWVRSASPASPPPSVVAIKGVLYQVMNASETHVGSDKTYTSKLYVARTTMADDGLYVCFASDGSSDYVTKQVSLTVIPQQPYYQVAENSSPNHEVWWIAAALVVSATTCVLILCFIFQRRRPHKMISVPAGDVLHDFGSSSVSPTSLC